jgi:hypothetical protein
MLAYALENATCMSSPLNLLYWSLANSVNSPD